MQSRHGRPGKERGVGGIRRFGRTNSTLRLGLSLPGALALIELENLHGPCQITDFGNLRTFPAIKT